MAKSVTRKRLNERKFEREQGQWHSVDQKTIQDLSSTGRHQECLKACQQLLQNESETPFPWKYAGKSLLALGQVDKAQQCLTKAHQLDTSDPETAKDIGNSFLNLGNKDAASQWYEKSLSVNNNYAPAINNLANLKRQSGNNKEALNLYRKAIQADPQLAQAHAGAAASSLALGDLDQAESFAIGAIDINAHAPGINEILGITYQNKKNYQQAVESYQRELAINPKSNISLLNLGVLLLQQGQAAVAIEPLKTVASLNPSEQCSFLLAQAYQKIGKLNEAIAEYKRLDVSISKNKMVPFNLGLCLLNTGSNIDAIEAFKLAIKIDESFLSAWGNIGTAFMNEGRYHEALPVTQKVLELDPDIPTAHMNLGIIFKNLGNLDQALASTLKSLELEADNPTAHMILGVIYKDLGNLDQALASTLKSIELKYDNPIAHMNLGGIYKNLGNLDQALASNLKSLELKPDNPIAHMNVGGIYKNLGNLDQALTSTLKSIELKSDNSDAHMNLGAIYLELRQYKYALSAALKSIDLQPGNSDNYVNLCEVYMAINDMPRAAKSVNHAIKLDNQNARAFLLIGKISLELGDSLHAEKQFINSIKLNNKLVDSYRYLSIVQCASGNYRASIESIENAIRLSPNCPHNKEIEAIVRSRLNEAESPTSSSLKSRFLYNQEVRFPVTFKRPVEKGLVQSLRELEYVDLQKRNLPTKGSARTSDFSFFENNRKNMQFLEQDLVALAKEAVGTNIYIKESWFTILTGGGFVEKHCHESELSRIKAFTGKCKKFALVYYVDVGDQSCDEPGFLKFYDPEEYILPVDGMVIIFPAERCHSVTYSGANERTIVGMNFWSI